MSNSTAFTVRENVLSDNSLTYDVLCFGQILFDTLNETEAFRLRDKLRQTIRDFESKAVSDEDFNKKDIAMRLNILSYKFGFDSKEARTISEAAALLSNELS